MEIGWLDVCALLNDNMTQIELTLELGSWGGGDYNSVGINQKLSPLLSIYPMA